MHNSQKIIAVLLSVLIALLIITALTPIVSGQTNILSNSGFEGDLTGWSTVPGTATYTYRFCNKTFRFIVSYGR